MSGYYPLENYCFEENICPSYFFENYAFEERVCLIVHESSSSKSSFFSFTQDLSTNLINDKEKHISDIKPAILLRKAMLQHIIRLF